MSIIYYKTLVLHNYLFRTLSIVNKIPNFQLFFFLLLNLVFEVFIPKVSLSKICVYVSMSNFVVFGM